MFTVKQFETHYQRIKARMQEHGYVIVPNKDGWGDDYWLDDGLYEIGFDEEHEEIQILKGADVIAYIPLQLLICFEVSSTSTRRGYGLFFKFGAGDASDACGVIGVQ